MLCKTASPGSTYNDIRLRDNCNVIIIMEGDYAVSNPDRAKWDSYRNYSLKPSYMLDGNSIMANSVRLRK